MSEARSGAFEPILLRSDAGLEAAVLPHGATLMRVRVPDATGQLRDVALGFDEPATYAGAHPHVGGIVGRYANRIANARFRLDGRSYQLSANDGPHCLHGGPRGFDRASWEIVRVDAVSVELRLVSPDGDAGFPGRLEVRATWWLEARSVGLRCVARCDAPTVVSLAHHGYWNLEDGGAGTVLAHRLQIAADRVTRVDPAGIPTGVLDPVADTPLDFRTPRAIGERIDALLESRGGYDHNFELDTGGTLAREAARLVAPRSGLALSLATTQPGLQVYSANSFDAARSYRDGRRTPRFGALALEAQQFPDAPNQPGFPAARLDPGEHYDHSTVYRFENV